MKPECQKSWDFQDNINIKVYRTNNIRKWFRKPSIIPEYLQHIVAVHIVHSATTSVRFAMGFIIPTVYKQQHWTKSTEIVLYSLRLHGNTQCELLQKK